MVDMEQRTLTVYLNGRRCGVMVGPHNVASDLKAVDVARGTPVRGATGGANLVAPLSGPLRFAIDIPVGSSVRIERQPSNAVAEQDASSPRRAWELRMMAYQKQRFERPPTPTPEPEPEVILAVEAMIKELATPMHRIFTSVSKGVIRAGSTMDSEAVGKLNTGERLVVSEALELTPGGVVRVRFDRGWASVTTAKGKAQPGSMVDGEQATAVGALSPCEKGQKGKKGKKDKKDQTGNKKSTAPSTSQQATSAEKGKKARSPQRRHRGQGGSPLYSQKGATR
eukprot:COSAG05_NODE_4618_length_1436_cov_1.996260_1_plen_282_part_00